MENHNYQINNYNDKFIVENWKPPITTIRIGKAPGLQIGVDKKFNWFQKKMIKWCFGFEVKENKQ